jgi:diaminopimelate epimerase
MKIQFTKMHGCGNDYIYINGAEVNIPHCGKPAVVRKLSDRHFGVGADGVIFINPSPTGSADFEMEMYNMDGSRGEMCGNGIRCVGKYVYDRGMTKSTDLTIESCGAIHPISLLTKDGRAVAARVDMGAPILRAGDIPVLAKDGEDTAPVIDEPVEADGKIWKMTCVSMGNPHAVLFPEEPVRHLDLASIGPALENNVIFPKKSNIEFVQIIDRRTVEMRVWERGSGETLACGTGCCATGVACVLKGLTDDKITVKVLGGEIEIEWDRAADKVWMTGPAQEVFEGFMEV